MKTSKYLAPLAVLAGMAGFGSPAHALLTVRLQETGGGSFQVVDNGANDVNTAIGVVEINGTAATAALQFFDIGAIESISNAPGSLATGTTPQIFALGSTGSVFRRAGTAGTQTLTVSSSDNGFVVTPFPPGTGATGTVTRELGATGIFTNAGTGDSQQNIVYNDPSNTLFGLVNPLSTANFNATGTALRGTNQAFAGNVDGAGITETLFSMTDVTIITLGANDPSLPLVRRRDQFGVSQTKTANAVPEPATMAMLFSALPILGLGALRRRKQQG